MIRSKNGMLWDAETHYLDVPEADEVARAAGFQYAEELVGWLAGRQRFAASIAARAVSADGLLILSRPGKEAQWRPGQEQAMLSGDFSVETLRAIAWWMKNYNTKAETWYHAQTA